MKVKAAKLVWDTTIYPRADVNADNIKSLSEALSLGDTLPPIIVDKKTMRIVDGVHRWRAYQRVYGETCEVPCEMRTYENEADIFIDAVRLNSVHGIKIMPTDKVRCFYIGERLGIEKEKLANAMRLKFEHAERMIISRTAYRDVGKKLKEPVFLKGSMKSLAGQVLSDDQIVANEYAGGMPPLYYINHLINMIKTGVFKERNEKIETALIELHELLNEELMVKS